jgi:hypothetical protein
VTTDKSKRVRLPEAKPGQVFDYAYNADGVFILTPAKKAEPEAVKAWLEKRGKRTVIVTDRPVSPEELLKEIREMT